MQFKPTAYLEAVKEMDFSSVECNLAFSGVDCPYSLAELGVTATVLEPGEFESYGSPALKMEIAAQYQVNEDQILSPGGGSTLCNFLITAALVDRGDRILIESPTYEPLYALAESTGAEVLPLPRPMERSFDLDIDEIHHLMKPPVKLVILTRLHNPSGRDIAPDLLIRIGEQAAEIGAYVLVDEVYLDFLHAEQRKPACTLHPRLLSVNSLTKVYGLGWMRIGWAVGPADLIWKAWRINNLLGSIPPSISERVAWELFRSGGIERIGAWARRRARENLDIVTRWIAARSELEWIKPDGGIIAYIRLKQTDSAEAFLDVLRAKFRTAVMPGKYFDLPGGFRLGFGVNPPALNDGLRRIGLALSEWT